MSEKADWEILDEEYDKAAQRLENAKRKLADAENACIGPKAEVHAAGLVLDAIYYMRQAYETGPDKAPPRAPPSPPEAASEPSLPEGFIKWGGGEWAGSSGDHVEVVLKADRPDAYSWRSSGPALGYPWNKPDDVGKRVIAYRILSEPNTNGEKSEGLLDHQPSPHDGQVSASEGDKPCTCHPDDRLPGACMQKFAATECHEAWDKAEYDRGYGDGKSGVIVDTFANSSTYESGYFQGRDDAGLGPMFPTSAAAERDTPRAIPEGEGWVAVFDDSGVPQEMLNATNLEVLCGNGKRMRADRGADGWEFNLAEILENGGRVIAFRDAPPSSDQLRTGEGEAARSDERIETQHDIIHVADPTSLDQIGEPDKPYGAAHKDVDGLDVSGEGAFAGRVLVREGAE